MSDIVERLRDMHLMRGGKPESYLGKLRAEAANTIEQLRTTVNDQAATITKLFDEVQQLQERLTSDKGKSP